MTRKNKWHVHSSPIWTKHELNKFHLNFMKLLFSIFFNYKTIRIIARPTAEMETTIPIQYLITSYFAASRWALNAWISCKQANRCHKSCYFSNTIISYVLTWSSLLVRLVVSALCWASSSRIRLKSWSSVISHKIEPVRLTVF